MNDNSLTLTASVKQYLDSDIEPSTLQTYLKQGSVLDLAAAEGLTVQQWVNEDPDTAIRQAEQALSEWLKIQTRAATRGVVEIDGEEYIITKNMTTLLVDRVSQAHKQLDMINECAYVAYKSGEQRRQHLVRALYNRAVYKGDTRAAIYLIDRVDGRPAETTIVETDRDNAWNCYQIIHTLFDKQLEVLNSGNGTKLICCTRRAGKTLFFSAVCLLECLRCPGVTSIYIGETMEITDGLVDEALNYIIDKCNLRDKKGKRLNWRHLDNGSKIIIRGLSNTKDPDLIRGHKAKRIVVDEFYHLKSELLDYIVKEVLQPMQMDYADDYMFLCGGTPPSVKGTYGEYAWKNWNVPHFTWTWKDNPYPVSIEKREKYVINILKEKGLDFTSSFARREYGGEWIYDDDLLLYPEFHCYNPREAHPSFNVDQVLFGIDYGVGDNDTLIGIAWDNEQRRGYVFHEDKFNRLDIKDRTISQLQYLEQQIKYAWTLALEFFPTLEPREANKRILWDADDNDQHCTDHFNMNIRLDKHPDLRLEIQNAHKTDKVIMYDKIRDLFRTASLLLPEGGKTAKECESTVLR